MVMEIFSYSSIFATLFPHIIIEEIRNCKWFDHFHCFVNFRFPHRNDNSPQLKYILQTKSSLHPYCLPVWTFYVDIIKSCNSTKIQKFCLLMGAAMLYCIRQVLRKIIRKIYKRSNTAYSIFTVKTSYFSRYLKTINVSIFDSDTLGLSNTWKKQQQGRIQNSKKDGWWRFYH